MQVRTALTNFRIIVQIPYMLRHWALKSNCLTGNEVYEPDTRFIKKNIEKSQHNRSNQGDAPLRLITANPPRISALLI